MTGRSTASKRTALPVTGKGVAALVLVAVALTFIVQNRQVISILLFIPVVFAPLWAAFAGVLVVGLVAGYLFAWRRR
jgi:tryptophan-rich sensory protein